MSSPRWKYIAGRSDSLAIHLVPSSSRMALCGKLENGGGWASADRLFRDVDAARKCERCLQRLERVTA